MDLQVLAGAVGDIVAGLPEIGLVYLFGSRAAGNATAQSDYDFAILVDRDADGPMIRDRFAAEIGAQLDNGRIDVVLLRQAFIELAYAVIAEGVILFQRDVATRVEFEAVVMSRYGDYLPVLRTHREQIFRDRDDERRIQRYRAALGRTERTLGQIARAADQVSKRV